MSSQSALSRPRIVAFRLATDPSTRLFVVLITAANAIAIGVPAFIDVSGGRVPGELDVMIDRSYPEMLNYAQTTMCTLLLLATFARTRQPLFLSFALIFIAIGLDDAFSYHERFGTVLTQQFSLPAIGGLRAQDSGELLAWIIGAVILAPTLLLTLRRADPPATATAFVLAACLAGLVFCGVGLDMLHILINNRFVGYLEDGGEMVCIAAACISTFAIYRAARERRQPIDGISGSPVVVPVTHA